MIEHAVVVGNMILVALSVVSKKEILSGYTAEVVSYHMGGIQGLRCSIDKIIMIT